MMVKQRTSRVKMITNDLSVEILEAELQDRGVLFQATTVFWGGHVKRAYFQCSNLFLSSVFHILMITIIHDVGFFRFFSPTILHNDHDHNG